MDAKLTEATCIINEASTAWMAEQRRFRKLAAAVCTASRTVESQKISLTYALQVLRGVRTAAPRSPSRGSAKSPAKNHAMCSSAGTANVTISPEVK